MRRVIQCVVHIGKLLRVGKDIVHNDSADRIALPHVFKCNLQFLSLKKRNQRTVKVQIIGKQFLLSAVVTPPLYRMHNDLTYPERLCKGKHLREARYNMLIVIRIPAAERRMCLCENHIVLPGNLQKAFCIFRGILSCRKRQVSKKGKINRIVAGTAKNFNSPEHTETPRKCFRLCSKNHFFSSSVFESVHLPSPPERMTAPKKAVIARQR